VHRQDVIFVRWEGQSCRYSLDTRRIPNGRIGNTRFSFYFKLVGLFLHRGYLISESLLLIIDVVHHNIEDSHQGGICVFEVRCQHRFFTVFRAI
jgi:hypothetical protein